MTFEIVAGGFFIRIIMSKYHLSNTAYVHISYGCLFVGIFLAQMYWSFAMSIFPFLIALLCANVALAFGIPTQYRFNRITEGSPYKSNLHDIMTIIISVAMIFGPIWMGNNHWFVRRKTNQNRNETGCKRCCDTIWTLLIPRAVFAPLGHFLTFFDKYEIVKNTFLLL